MNLAALRRWWPLAAVLGLLSFTALAATRSAPQLDRFDPDATPAPTTVPPLLPPSATPPTQPSGTPAPTESGLPAWVGEVALYVVLAIVVVVLAAALWALLKDGSAKRAKRAGKRRRRPAGRTQEDLVAALDAGLEELSDTDRDPRRAVIACWVRLEQAAADAGTPRHPGDSPADLVGRLLAEHRVDAALLAALAEVYRTARYATHTVDDQMRRQARTALERVRTDLGAGVAG